MLFSKQSGTDGDYFSPGKTIVVCPEWHLHIRVVYQRLLANGKSKMSALGAAMRKLAHLCFGVVSSGKPYDPAFTSKKS